MRLPQDAWWLSRLLPIAARSKLVHSFALRERAGVRISHRDGVTEGRGTPCPFWRFGEVYA